MLRQFNQFDGCNYTRVKPSVIRTHMFALIAIALNQVSNARVTDTQYAFIYTYERVYLPHFARSHHGMYVILEAAVPNMEHIPPLHSVTYGHY